MSNFLYKFIDICTIVKYNLIMNKNIIVFSLKINYLDISNVFEKTKFYHTNLILCDNARLFYNNYNCNIEFILYYPNDLSCLKNILKIYPKEIKFNLVNIYDFLSNNYQIKISKQCELANKNLMTYFLNTINIFSINVSSILINRILINAINFNIPHIKSSLIYYTFYHHNMLPSKLIPILRDFLKNWIKSHGINKNKTLNFNVIKKIKINDCINTILSEYKIFINNFSNKKEFIESIDKFFSF